VLITFAPGNSPRPAYQMAPSQCALHSSMTSNHARSLEYHTSLAAGFPFASSAGAIVRHARLFRSCHLLNFQAANSGQFPGLIRPREISWQLKYHSRQQSSGTSGIGQPLHQHNLFLLSVLNVMVGIARFTIAVSGICLRTHHSDHTMWRLAPRAPVCVLSCLCESTLAHGCCTFWRDSLCLINRRIGSLQASDTPQLFWYLLL